MSQNWNAYSLSNNTTFENDEIGKRLNTQFSMFERVQKDRTSSSDIRELKRLQPEIQITPPIYTETDKLNQEIYLSNLDKPIEFLPLPQRTDASIRGHDAGFFENMHIRRR